MIATDMPRFPSPRSRRWRRWLRRGEDPGPALLLAETLEALGRTPPCTAEPHDRHRNVAQTVPVTAVVGTVARGADFDRALQPTREQLRERWNHIASVAATGTALPPVSLVRVGDLYFVEDGHHRISMARTRGQLAVDAHVRTVCTVAFGCACLTRAHLDTKAAERDFLTTVPLTDPALRQLWLDDPADYEHLAAAARAWIAQHRGPAQRCCVDCEAAAAWWDHEVLPLAHTCGCTGTSVAAAYLFARELS